jgi:hypothetical protein
MCVPFSLGGVVHGRMGGRCTHTQNVHFSGLIALGPKITRIPN